MKAAGRIAAKLAAGSEMAVRMAVKMVEGGCEDGCEDGCALGCALGCELGCALGCELGSICDQRSAMVRLCCWCLSSRVAQRSDTPSATPEASLLFRAWKTIWLQSPQPRAMHRETKFPCFRNF